MSLLLPIPNPELPRVHSVTNTEQTLTDFKTFIEECVGLVILGDFENSDTLIDSANFLCTQETAPENQRVLWLKTEEEIEQVREVLTAKLKEFRPEEDIPLENVRAVSITPKIGKIAFVIYADPTKAINRRDRRKRMSVFNMQRAFIKAIRMTPTDIVLDQPENA